MKSQRNRLVNSYCLTGAIFLDVHVSASGPTGVVVGYAVDSANGLVLEGTNAVILGRTRSSVIEDLIVNTLQLATVFISDSVIGTSRLVSRSAKAGRRLADTLVSNDDGFAICQAFIVVSNSINAADRLVNLSAYAFRLGLRLGLADTLISNSDEFASSQAFIAVSNSIIAADGLVNLTADAVRILVAGTFIFNGHGFAIRFAFIAIGYSINSTDRLINIIADTFRLGLAFTLISNFD